MKKKIKKIGYRIGIIPIIIVLSMGLLTGGVVLAEEPEPLSASVEVTVDPALPNYLLNDGTGIEEIDWEITYDSTPREYTYEIFDPTDTSVYGPITVTLPGTTPGEGSPVTGGYDWTVPAGSATGTYTVRVEYFSEDTYPDFEGASENTFRVKQAVEVRKFEDIDGNGIMDGSDSEILGTWNVQIWDPGMVSIYNGTMPAVIDVMGDGTYTATETLKAGWVVTTPPGSPSVTRTFVIPDDTEVIWFGNQEIPPEGDLLIHKYIDTNGDSVDNDGVDGVGWTFDVYGPDDLNAPYALGQVTDTYGDILLTAMPVGQYKVVETLMVADPVWKCTDPGAGLTITVNVVAETQTDIDFGNQQQGDLLIYKYEDIDGDGYTVTDPPGEGWYFSVSGPSGIINVGPTDVSGYILVQDLIPGSYTVTEKSGPSPPAGYGWVCTDPGPGKTKSGITVPSGGTSAEVQFGNRLIERLVPTLGQWGIIGMSTVFAGLLVWFGVRRRRLAQMK